VKYTVLECTQFHHFHYNDYLVVKMGIRMGFVCWLVATFVEHPMVCQSATAVQGLNIGKTGHRGGGGGFQVTAEETSLFTVQYRVGSSQIILTTSPSSPSFITNMTNISTNINCNTTNKALYLTISHIACLYFCQSISH
jgi:hypothetical protein